MNPVEVKQQDAMSAIGRSFELTFEEFVRIPELASQALPQLHSYLPQHGIAPAGPNVFEYRFHDSPHGPRRIVGGRFTLTIAVPVAQEVAQKLTPPEPIALVSLAPFTYVELVTNSFGDEWRRIRDIAEQSGFERSLLEREIYLAWHGEGHPETQVALQVGVR